MPLNDEQALRYSAHHALRSFGTAAQSRLSESRVALVGLGGLGCAAAQYLASSGVGQLTICDFDRVETSNLARQILYGPDDRGLPKTEVASRRLAALNPDVNIIPQTERVDPAMAHELAGQHDLVIDASDNYGTRLAINRAALDAATPWIMGSCVRQEGQLILFKPGEQGPCYRCAYGTAPDTLEDCPGAGVLAPVAGVVGTAMALIAVQHLAGLDTDGGMHLLDGARLHWRRLAVGRRPDCPDCGR